jgi:ethanolamine utilization protein EutS
LKQRGYEKDSFSGPFLFFYGSINLKSSNEAENKLFRKRKMGWVKMGEKLEKERVIQEYVPGKQVTLAHIIANPNADLFKKLGLSKNQTNAIGILTITPGEASIIAADIATKAGNVELGFVDRFSGSVVITGDVSSVEYALKEVIRGLAEILNFTTPTVTRT